MTGFTLLELLVVIAVIAILAALLLPTLSRVKDKTYVATDLNNTRQIMQAMYLYCSDDNDFMPHCTYGTDSTNPDGWAYGTKLMSRFAGPATNPATLELQVSNQIEAFKTGQLAGYLGNNSRILMCPKDVAESAGAKKNLYLQRAVNITSYVWNDNVGGYVAARTGRVPWLQPDGRTFKLSTFQANNVLQWETDELVPIYFNDAGNNPWEGISQRHAGGAAKQAGTDVKGKATVGCIGGNAYSITYRRWYEMAGIDQNPWGNQTIHRIVPGPNDLYYDPRDKWGAYRTRRENC
jgi:prepilin-type N-terminal cleavage/methylation domain-containing protein